MNKIFELIRYFNKTKRQTWTTREIIKKILEFAEPEELSKKVEE